MSSEAKILTRDNVEMIAEWCGGRAVLQHDALDHDRTIPAVNVRTETGDVERAQVGDLVIRNHDGSFRIHKHE